MKIGILYICLGKYDFFWESFYKSAESYFFQDTSWTREYFVFTDAPLLYGEETDEHIHRIRQDNLGWPDNTMKRFEMFLSIRDRLEEMDYLFFFNANMEFLAPVGEEILPSVEENGLVGVLHSWYFDTYRWNYSYERRRSSSAFIPYWQGKYYFQGSLLGGKTSDFLQLCETCNKMVYEDLSKGIIPVWHDESIVNKYFIKHQPKVLDPHYNYCEIRNLPIPKIILLKDKMKYFSFTDLNRQSYKECHAKKTFWENLLVGGLNYIVRFWRIINKE